MRQESVMIWFGSTTSTSGSLRATSRILLMLKPYTFSHPMGVWCGRGFWVWFGSAREIDYCARCIQISDVSACVCVFKRVHVCVSMWWVQSVGGVKWLTVNLFVLVLSVFNSSDVETSFVRKENATSLLGRWKLNDLKIQILTKTRWIHLSLSLSKSYHTFTL